MPERCLSDHGNTLPILHYRRFGKSPRIARHGIPDPWRHYFFHWLTDVRREVHGRLIYLPWVPRTHRSDRIIGILTAFVMNKLETTITKLINSSGIARSCVAFRRHSTLSSSRHTICIKRAIAGITDMNGDVREFRAVTLYQHFSGVGLLAINFPGNRLNSGTVLPHRDNTIITVNNFAKRATVFNIVNLSHCEQIISLVTVGIFYTTIFYYMNFKENKQPVKSQPILDISGKIREDWCRFSSWDSMMNTAKSNPDARCGMEDFFHWQIAL